MRTFSRLTTKLPINTAYYSHEIRLISNKIDVLSLQSGEHYKTNIHCYEFASHLFAISEDSQSLRPIQASLQEHGPKINYNFKR